ncbi:MAG: hypothetical protein Ta2B_16000 [Termitinemataceae bacterium]|nr:MAG: hypothetical protein Ta2B_16000 [Termitinemataceae bacterium]
MACFMGYNTIENIKADQTAHNIRYTLRRYCGV